MAVLKAKFSGQAVTEAIEEVDARRKGLLKGIQTPWRKFNNILGGFQPGWAYMFAASSGVGKTTILTILENAFFEYNNDKILVLSWNLEISSTMILLKKVSADMGVELDRIMSFNQNDPLSDADFDKIVKCLRKFETHTVRYFEEGTVQDIEDTILYYREKAPDFKIVTALDHTLLVQREKERDNNELVANIGKMSIKVKKSTGSTFLFLGQLNGNQEKIERLQNPQFHAPIKDDLYGGKEIWHALDTVIIPVRPDLLNLDYYTNAQLECADRMYMHIIKNRFGNSGYIPFDTSQIGVNRLIEL